MWFSRIAVIILVISISVTVKGQQIKVTIQQGTVSGIVSISERGSQYFSFFGIPYAAPPIGELRFKDPIKHPGWSDELQATEYGPICPQGNPATSAITGQEDCLTVNVHTPQLPSMHPVEPLPVIFAIHGGGFLRGYSAIYGASKILSEPVVLVSVNYRLGILGFLSTEDAVSPGNYGMMDLILALQWVRDNIASFGGDGRRVTILGESTGAAIASHLILSPLAKGLFWAAITQSGSAICKWAFEEHPLRFVRPLAASLGCDVTKSDSIFNCLRQKSPDDIVRAEMKMATGSYKPTPVVDKGLRSQAFLPDTPERLLQSGDFSKVPLISGVTESEGLFFLMRRLQQYAKEIASDPTFMERVIVPLTTNTYMEYTPDKVDLLKNFYLRNVNYTNITEVIPPLSEVIGDIMINSCNDQLVKLHSEYAPTYMYVFTHRGLIRKSDSIIAALRQGGIDPPIFDTGVSHADELLFQFHLPNIETSSAPDDKRVQEILIHLWMTFARTGNPNIQLASSMNQSTFWKRLLSTDLTYLNISLHPELGKDFRQFQLSFLDYIDKIVSEEPEKYTDISEASFTWLLTAGLLVACTVLTAGLIIKTGRGNY